LGSGFHPDLTGLENIMLNAALLGYNERQARSVLDRIIDFAELGQFIGEPLRAYSAGMSVRLAFSIAVHVEPAILLVDEVLAVGDAAFYEKSVAKVRELLDSGKTMLCVSHSTEMIRSFCHRAIWLDHGRLIQDGPADEVTGAYLEHINHPERGLPGQLPSPVVVLPRPDSAQKKAAR
jgi:ABC-type polysaccharide/polyol phosphate transport system ATPase subunit